MICNIGSSQNSSIKGKWHGELASGLGQLQIIIELQEEPLSGTLSSSSGIQGMKLKEIQLIDNKFSFTVPMAEVKYEGVLEQDEIKGTWYQAGNSVALNFKRQEQETVLTSNRKQTPQPPFDYAVEEITFSSSKEKVQLAGTLTIPKGKGKFPAVILLSVAGANDRNQTHSLGHQPFLVLADYLTQNGIAVLRFDDRGIGESEGDLMQSNFDNLTNDALAAFDHLNKNPRIDPNKIGFIGNSEGTVIATMAAIENSKVAFTIQLGAVGVPLAELSQDRLDRMQNLYQLTEEQRKEIIQYGQAVDEIVKQNLLDAEAQQKIEALQAHNTYDKPNFPNHLFFLPPSKAERIKLFLTPWYKAQITYDPAPILSKLKTPTLVINGTLDVFQSPEVNFPAIQKLLFEAENQDFTLLVAPDINHVMQTAKTGLPTEYPKLEESFSPQMLRTIKDWIEVRFK